MVPFLPQGAYSYNEPPYSPAMKTIDRPAKAPRQGLLQDSVENNDPASKKPVSIPALGKSSQSRDVAPVARVCGGFDLTLPKSVPSRARLVRSGKPLRYVI